MSDHAHHFPVLALVAIGVGAALGAWLRWWLGLRLNPCSPTCRWAPWRPTCWGLPRRRGGGVVCPAHRSAARGPAFIVTGFLGGLTTFSSFSAEVVHLIDTARYAWALGAAALHWGLLCMTALGMWTVHVLRA